MREETFALDDPAEGPDYNAAVMELCARAGFTPATRELQTHHDAWERAIAAGDCVGVTTRSSTHATHPGVRVITLDPPTTFPLDLLWLPIGEARDRARRRGRARDRSRQHGWVGTSAGSTRSPR